MKYKTLGNTGLLVSQLCLGTMTFSDGTGVYEHIGDVDQSGADELVKTSLDAGINFFDTADVYSAGNSEATLGKSFTNLGVARTSYVLATKVYSRMGQGRNDVGASRGPHHGRGGCKPSSGSRPITSTSIRSMQRT